MHRLTPFLLALALLAFPVAATAGGDGFSVVVHIFEMADLDEDGALDADEYAAAGLERYGLTFEQSDLDGDGKTSLSEYLDLYEAHHPPADPVDDGAV